MNNNNVVVRSQKELSHDLKNMLMKKREDLIQVLPKNVSVDKFINVVMMAINTNPTLIKCDRKSIMIACLRSAQDGLYPDGREAVINPYYNEKLKIYTASYMAMVTGVLKKIRNKVNIISGTPHIRYEKDYFKRTLGDEEKIEHIPADGDRGKIIGVYVIVKTSDGERYAEYMSHDEIEKAKESNKNRKPGGPWDKWYTEMAKKCVLKRAEKRIPGRDGSDTIVYAEDEYEEEYVEKLEPPIPPTIENKTVETTQDGDISSVKKEITNYIGNMEMLENIWGYKVEPLLEEMNDDEKQDISSFYDDAINKTKMGK